MDFIIGKKYNRANNPYNPWTALAVTSGGLLFLEDRRGSWDVIDANKFQAHFTPAMQYPPCSLEEAEVGDTVETWGGDKYKVTRIGKSGQGYLSANWNYDKDGRWSSGDGDYDGLENARFLHKAHKGIEPLTVPQNYGSVDILTAKHLKTTNELVSAVNSLTDRVKHLESKQ